MSQPESEQLFSQGSIEEEDSAPDEFGVAGPEAETDQIFQEFFFFFNGDLFIQDCDRKIDPDNSVARIEMKHIGGKQGPLLPGGYQAIDAHIFQS